MKKLIFIDNDTNSDRHGDEIGTIKAMLELQGVENASFLVIVDFWRKTKLVMQELLYGEDRAIFSWSMYTSTHYNSLGQLVKFLSGAASNRLTDRIYVDGSGKIESTLNYYLEDSRHTVIFQVMQAIESNNIITRTEDGFKRLRINLDMRHDGYFKLEDCDMKALLEAN